MGRAVRWDEAVSLILELLRETGSHVHADVAGLRLAASQADLAAIIQAEWYVNVHRDRKKTKHITLPGPMPEERGPKPTDLELAEATAWADQLLGI